MGSLRDTSLRATSVDVISMRTKRNRMWICKCNQHRTPRKPWSFHMRHELKAQLRAARKEG